MPIAVAIIVQAIQGLAKDLLKDIADDFVDAIFQTKKNAASIESLTKAIKALIEYFQNELPQVVFDQVTLAQIQFIAAEIRAFDVRISACLAAIDAATSEDESKQSITDLRVAANDCFERTAVLGEFGQMNYFAFVAGVSIGLRAYAEVIQKEPTYVSSLKIYSANFRGTLSRWVDLKRAASLADVLTSKKGVLALSHSVMPLVTNGKDQSFLVSYQLRKINGDATRLQFDTDGAVYSIDEDGNVSDKHYSTIGQIGATPLFVLPRAMSDINTFKIPNWWSPVNGDYDKSYVRRCGEGLRALWVSSNVYPEQIKALSAAVGSIESLINALDKILDTKLE